MKEPQRLFYILGVSHRVQGEIDVRDWFVDPDYAAIVRDVISCEKIDFVGEEAGNHDSTAEKIAKELLGPRHYVNLNPEHPEGHSIGKLCLGSPLSSTAGEMWSIPDVDKMECLWVDILTEKTLARGLLICGFYHTFSVGVKLLKIGSVKAKTYLPHDKLCSHRTNAS